MPFCSEAFGRAFHALVDTAEVHEVAVYVDRARQQVPLDGYAMSVAMVFAQVRPFSPIRIPLSPAGAERGRWARWARVASEGVVARGARGARGAGVASRVVWRGVGRTFL